MVLYQRTVEQRDDGAEHGIAADCHRLLRFLGSIERRISEHVFRFHQDAVVEGQEVILTLMLEAGSAFQSIRHELDPRRSRRSDDIALRILANTAGKRRIADGTGRAARLIIA